MVEGFGLSQTQPEEAPGRYARWLKETACTPAFNPIRDLAQVAAKLMERSPHLSLPRAQWLAQQLTRPDGVQQLTYRPIRVTRWLTLFSTGWKKPKPAGDAFRHRCYG
nr:hypothetical protein [Paludibacterium denitrificans]